jgi:surfactin synthase thioesterase subunit
MNFVKTYRYYTARSLDLPISVFLGKRDRWVAYEDHLGWAAHTQKKFTIHEFDSGHLFIKEDAIKKQMLQKIMADIPMV